MLKRNSYLFDEKIPVFVKNLKILRNNLENFKTVVIDIRHRLFQLLLCCKQTLHSLNSYKKLMFGTKGKFTEEFRGRSQTTNCVDKILGFFFDHLPTCVDIFYGMNVDKKWTF
jgi:hypothetical protein